MPDFSLFPSSLADVLENRFQDDTGQITRKKIIRFEREILPSKYSSAI
jgi:hypothetical protein